MQLNGRYYAPDSSRSRPVRITLAADGSIQVHGAQLERSYRLTETRVSDRLGDIVRTLTFADGALCEVEDNDGVDTFMRDAGLATGGDRVHALERRWGWALAAVIALAATGVLFVTKGVPAIASTLAFNLPPEIDDRLGLESLQVMDRFFFEPSVLDEEVIARLQRRFVQLARAAGDNEKLKLVFRSSAKTGPNAFALPSGTIVMTDELVELAERDEELEAVLAHEIGHVYRRHTLRLILQDSITAGMLAVLLGDVASVTSLAATVPTVVAQRHYSRQFESEADDFALELMRETGLDPAFFAAILRRMEQLHDGEAPADFFSTHPPTEKRLRRFE